MEINKLIEIVKEKISKEIILQEINVEDKSFLHKDHKNNSPNKFHIKISIISDELKSKKKIDSTKKIYKIYRIVFIIFKTLMRRLRFNRVLRHSMNFIFL